MDDFVRKHLQLQDEIGPRPYEDGRPAGAFQSASALALAQSRPGTCLIEASGARMTTALT
jgi:hypothetical protein